MQSGEGTTRGHFEDRPWALICGRGSVEVSIAALSQAGFGVPVLARRTKAMERGKRAARTHAEYRPAVVAATIISGSVEGPVAGLDQLPVGYIAALHRHIV